MIRASTCNDIACLGLSRHGFAHMPFKQYTHLTLSFELNFSLFGKSMTILTLLQIRPLIGPTKAIMEVHISTYKWHEFFPNGTKTFAMNHHFLFIFNSVTHQ